METLCYDFDNSLWSSPAHYQSGDTDRQSGYDKVDSKLQSKDLMPYVKSCKMFSRKENPADCMNEVAGHRKSRKEYLNNECAFVFGDNIQPLYKFRGRSAGKMENKQKRHSRKCDVDLGSLRTTDSPRPKRDQCELNNNSRVNNDDSSGMTSVKDLNQPDFQRFLNDVLVDDDQCHPDPEVLSFLAMLFSEGVNLERYTGNSVRDTNVPSETSTSGLCQNVQNFLASVVTGKCAREMHWHILSFLKFLLQEDPTNLEDTQDSTRYTSAAAECPQVFRAVDILSELNKNNHRACCMPTLRKLNRDLKRVCEQNRCLRAENLELRNNIRLHKKMAAEECAKILNAIIKYCEAQVECSSSCPPPKECPDTFAGFLGRLGAGCSSGGCGGYTPSGWNKIMTKTRALCDSDPCTCCTPSNPCRPSCTPSNPCRTSCNPCKSCSPCKPYNPCSPCSPCKPYNPCDPCSPCKPYNPCNPCSPCKPYSSCNPCSPCKPYNPCSPCKPYTSCNPCKPYNPCSDSTCPPYKFKSLCRPALCCTDICNSQAPSDDSTKCRPSLKLLGELAFQLERRILDYVFGMEDSKRRRFYGYTVSNIFSMMERETKFPKGGSDVITKSELAGRLKKLLQALERYGYNIKTHGEFAQEMVNKYGLLACPPDESTIAQFGLNDPNAIAHLIQQLAQGPSEIGSLTVLLNSLKYLSKCDQRPLFIW
ncbi:unnamed protein product [Lymnaea stagnalis]|uniref:Speriolin C-terminal domain-containing protein n=1 Tax=Lymnaea stagnalis TaxID=6523 RepID=A0AAV2HL49_LYMST